MNQNEEVSLTVQWCLNC